MSISEKVSIWVYIAMDAAIVGAIAWYVALKTGAVVRSRGMLKRGLAVHNIVVVAAILAIFCAALGFVLVQGARHPMVPMQ
jgi:hypothetical protein